MILYNSKIQSQLIIFFIPPIPSLLIPKKGGHHRMPNLSIWKIISRSLLLYFYYILLEVKRNNLVSPPSFIHNIKISSQELS